MPAPLLSLFAFAALISAAAAAYPGGTWNDPRSAGFSFWSNFWCDLLAGVALDGRTNRIGALLARLAFACFALALLRFWPLAAAASGRRPGSTPERLGTFGALSLIAVAIVPAAISQIAHGLAVVLSAGCSLAGVVSLLPDLWRRSARRAALLGASVVATALACLLQYVYQGCFAREGATWLPALQKITTALLLAFMLQLLVQAQGAFANAHPRTPET